MFVLKLMFWLIELTLMVGIFSYCFYITGLFISRFMEVPFVPSDTAAVRQAFTFIRPSPGMKLLELGCGDGKIICNMVKKYHLYGRGIDMNPIFILVARLRAVVMGIAHSVTIVRGDARNADFAWADIIYIFMVPRFVNDKIFSNRFRTRTRPGTYIISHWYEIEYFRPKEVHRIHTGSHISYVYRI